MIAGLKPYAAYKDSGQDWLSSVPEHWNVLPNRVVFDEVKDRNQSREQMLSVTITRGIVPQRSLLADSSKKDGSNTNKSAHSPAPTTFLVAILPYGVQTWEKLSIFLNFLIAKLPAPVEEDLARDILDAIDMDSYRAEKRATLAIALPDVDAEIEPVTTSGGGRKPEPELDRLSNIVKAFNEQFGGLFADP